MPSRAQGARNAHTARRAPVYGLPRPSGQAQIQSPDRERRGLRLPPPRVPPRGFEREPDRGARTMAAAMARLEQPGDVQGDFAFEVLSRSTPEPQGDQVATGRARPAVRRLPSSQFQWPRNDADPHG